MNRRFVNGINLQNKFFISTLQSRTSSTLADLAITNVNVIGAVNGIRHDVSVFIRGDRMADVQERSSTAKHSAKMIINGCGKSLLPGLWDAHVHLTFSEKIADSMFRIGKFECYSKYSRLIFR